MAGGFSNGFSDGFDTFYVMFITLSLPYGRVNRLYYQELESDVPSTWAVTSGVLPSGLSMNNSGVFSGTPTTVQTSEFEVSATYGVDAFYNNYSIVILAAATTTWKARNGSDIFRRLDF